MSSKTAGERARERKTIGRTAAWLAKQVEISLGSVDLSLPQYRVLGLLDESPAFSSALAERLAVRPPSVTAIVDGLVARGLVERRPVESDRRPAADAPVAARLRDIAGCLDEPADAERAFDGLTAWRQALLAYRSARRSVR